MKTPNEWELIIFNNPTMTINSLVSQVQTEAWNEAIEAAAKNARTMPEPMGSMRSEIVDKQSILKLKI